MRRLRSVAALLPVIAVLAVACGKDSKPAEQGKLAAVEIDDHACEACGMLVREQSAPRAQLVHRDGQRQFFCSIGDLFAYLEAPSPHGRVVATFVEALDPQADPLKFDASVHSWVKAEDASYVLGVDKKRVMGTPVLVYQTNQQAMSIAAKYGAKAQSWQELRANLAQK